MIETPISPFHRGRGTAVRTFYSTAVLTRGSQMARLREIRNCGYLELVEQPVEGAKKRDERLAQVVSDESRVLMEREPQCRQQKVDDRRCGHVVDLFRQAKSAARYTEIHRGTRDRYHG